MSNLHPPVPVARAPRWFAWLGVITLAGYGVFLGVNSTVAAGGSDSSGYLNSARLLATGRLDTSVRIPPGFGDPANLFRPGFQPLGFIANTESSRMVPSYPTGFPLHLALAGKILGWTAGPLFVGLATALAAIVLCYLVGRELGLGWPLAAAAAVILAACPVLLLTSIQPLSDTLATAWCLAAALGALRARRHAGWAAVCGFAYAVAVLVRPTNLVLLPALIAFLGLNVRHLALAVLAGLPAAGWQAFYNHTLYGGMFRSGYPAIATAFAASYVVPSARNFLHWLGVFVPTLLLGLPFVALAHRDTRTRHLLGLALWFGAIVTVYLFYAISPEAWTCLRFILPALPALILAGMLGVEALARFRPAAGATRVRTGAAIVLGAWAVIVAWRWAPPNAVFYTKGYEDAYTAACLAARTQFPKDAVVLSHFASGAIYYYTDFPILRWDSLSTANFADYAAAAQRAGLPLCAVLFASEEEDAFTRHCPGNWQRLATVSGVGLWQLAPGPARATTK